MDRPQPAASSAGSGEPAAIGFSSFTLDLRGGRLLRDGATIPLRPKTWAVLLHLAERPGALISREALLDAVWPDVAVTPDTLTKSIGELRSVLGDDPRAPRFIETVHRRGFRFLGSPRPAGGATVAPAADAAPFVGRAAERQRLHDCLARAGRGERQLVFVSGPAGIGKTALVECFLGAPALQAATVDVALGASIEQHGLREPYMPVLEALERLARGPHAARVLDAVRATAPSWLAQIPWLARQEPGGPRSFQGARPERMLREGVALLEALAGDATLVLVLEDQHWSDPSTVDLVTRLGRRREAARLLLVATFRSAELAVQDHPLGLTVRALRGQRRCVEIPLHDLSVDDVGTYLAARFARATPPPALVGALHHHTGGNPLFLRATVDHMVAQGWILDTAPGWSFAGMPARPDFGVPGDARDMVALQVSRLAPADRRLLETASVACRDWTAALLASVLDRPIDEVAASTEALARGERFLRPSASPSHYAFAHELYRRAVYREIPIDRRRRLHRRVGDAIEAASGAAAADLAPDLAHHFEQGGDVDRALQYLVLAAHRARQRAAPGEASTYLEHALALVDGLARPVDRQRHELHLRLALAPILLDLAGPASTALLENCERALALCDAAGGARERFDLLHALAHVRVMRGDRAWFDGGAASLQALAREIGGADHAMLVSAVRCYVATIGGRFAEARQIADRFRAAARDERRAAHPVVGADPVVGVLNHGALSAWMMGRGQVAWAMLRDARAAAGAPDIPPFTRAQVDFFACLLATLERDPRRVLAGCDAALRLVEEHDLALWRNMVLPLRGWARLHTGDIAGGMAEIERARVAHHESGTVIFTTYILAFLAEGHLRTGDPEAARRVIDEALELAETTLDRSYWPELWRLKGEVALAAGGRSAPAEAEACLRRALEVARAGEAHTLELRAATSLARLWLTAGHAGEARRLVKAALRGVEAVDSADRRDAAALLSAPAKAKPPASTRQPGGRR